MEGLVKVSIVAGEDGSVVEQHHEVGSSSSSSVLSMLVGGGDGEGARGPKKRMGAQGAAKTKKRSRQNLEGSAGSSKEQTARRYRSADWSEDETESLLQAISLISLDKGRCRKSPGQSFWETIARRVGRRTPKECQDRMDTLTKSWRVMHSMKITEKLRDLKLATAMTVDWYILICEIKKVPCNARVVSTETGPVEEGDQSNASSPGFAAGWLVPEQADPVPHQQVPSPVIVHLHPPEASDGGTTAGVDEHLHRIPCPAPPAQAPVPGARVAAPPAPGSHKPHHDAHSPQPVVDAATPELDLPCDYAPGKVEDVLSSLEPEPHPDELVHKDGWIGDGTSTVVPLEHLLNIDLDTDSEDLHEWTGLDDIPRYLSDLQGPANPADDHAHMEATFSVGVFLVSDDPVDMF